MSDTLIEFLAQEAASLIIALAVAIFGAVGTWVLGKLGQKLGAERMQVLRDALAPAIQRAIARAEAENLTGDALKRRAAEYLRSTMADHLRKLGATEAQLKERIAAEVAVQAQTPPAVIIEDQRS